MTINTMKSGAEPRTAIAPERDGLRLSALTEAMGACTGYDPGPDPNYDEEPIPGDSEP